MIIKTVDDVEIEFEQQDPAIKSCRWCVYVRVAKNKHEKVLLCTMSHNKPHVKFTYCSPDQVINSNEVKKALCQ